MPTPQSDGTAPPLNAERREVKRILALLKKAPLTLADYHAIGEQMRRLAADEAVNRRGNKWRDRVAELAGCSVSTLTKAMQLRSAYEEPDLAALEQMGVGWSRLTIALAVDDRKKRHALIQEAKDRGWGERELQRAIQQFKGSKRSGGRPRKQMHSQGPLADAAELRRLTELWLEYEQAVWAKTKAADLKGLDETAAANLRRILEGTAASLKLLQARAKEAKKLADSLLEG